MEVGGGVVVLCGGVQVGLLIAHLLAGSRKLLHGDGAALIHIHLLKVRIELPLGMEAHREGEGEGWCCSWLIIGKPCVRVTPG